MEATRTRQRSPNYPSTDLGVAIENARKLWSAYGRRLVSQDEAVRAWGYGSLSGASRSRMASLRQYGLIELNKDGDVALTRRGQLLAYGADPSSSDYDSALKEAALAPDIFRELYDTRRLSSNDAIRRHLVLDRKFSEEGAKKLVESFRSTLALAKLDGESYGDEGEALEETLGSRPSSNPARTVDSQERPVRGPIDHPLESLPAVSEQYSWPIPPDMTVEIKFRGGEVTSAHIEMLKGYLTHYQKRLEELERSRRNEPGSTYINAGPHIPTAAVETEVE